MSAITQNRGRGRPKGSVKIDANLRHPLYMTWARMRDRCNNPNSALYHRYGARGIKVCERWDNFRYFVSDMGPKPDVHHSIERIDNDGGYDPFNCIWAMPEQQQNNKRNCRYITHEGRKLTVAQWAREFGIEYNLFWRRLQRMSFLEAAALGPKPQTLGSHRRK